LCKSNTNNRITKYKAEFFVQLHFFYSFFHNKICTCYFLCVLLQKIRRVGHSKDYFFIVRHKSKCYGSAL
jgi:hypothetical protein